MKEALKETSIPIRLTELYDGEAAITFFKEVETGSKPLPDLVLLDLNLPKVKGYKILEYIKANAFLKKLPVIIIATSPEKSTILQCYELGANAYVLKPDNFDALVQAVNSLLTFWLGTVILPHMKLSARN